MAWEDIIPLATAPSRLGSDVAVCWKKSAVDAPWRLVVLLYRPCLARLQWDAGQKTRVQHDRAAGMLRLSPITDSLPVNIKAGALRITRAGAAGQLAIRMDGLAIVERQPVQPVEHKVEGGALLLTLPAWAAPERIAAPMTRPSGMADADIREAIGLIQTGTTDAGLAEWFGWGPVEIAFARSAAAARTAAVSTAHRKAA